MKMSTMLSVTTQHALRALSVLAGLPDGMFLLGRELAVRASIPANYLSKILWILGSAGFIGAARGNRGGYRLQKPAGEIRLVDIIELFEHNRTTDHCFLDGSRLCAQAERCTAHRAWRELDCAMNHFLETTTLADIAKDTINDRGTAHT
jgi:Rrf2 family protein